MKEEGREEGEEAVDPLVSVSQEFLLLHACTLVHVQRRGVVMVGSDVSDRALVWNGCCLFYESGAAIFRSRVCVRGRRGSEERKTEGSLRVCVCLWVHVSVCMFKKYCSLIK